MNTKILFLVLTGCLLSLAAWLVHVPNPVQADEVPEKYRDTVTKGLEYLDKNQFADGHWEGDDGKHPVAVTALTGMALLMEGSTVHKGKYSANIRKAVDWLMTRSQAARDGLIFSGHPSETDRYMYGHGLAVQFLAWAYLAENDKARREKLTDVVAKAVKYIDNARSTQGGWYRTSKVEGHDFDEILATAIQIQAMYMVREHATDAQEYVKVSLEKYEKGAKPGPNRSRPAETAAALACRSNPLTFLDQHGVCTTWFTYCRTEIPMGRNIQFGRDELTHYYYAQAVYNHTLNVPTPVVAWSDYRTALFDHLQSTQNKDGSWPAPAEAQCGIGVGPVYGTAVWCTILQLDKRNHPLTRERERRTR